MVIEVIGTTIAGKIVVGVAGVTIDKVLERCLPEVLSKLAVMSSKLCSMVMGQPRLRDVSEVGELLDYLKQTKDLESRQLTVTGKFFPAALLYPGYWNIKKDPNVGGNQHKLDLSGCNDLQRWLFEGFHQWGPSWDISLSNSQEKPYLLAQLALEDEAESIALIVARDKAKDVVSRFLDKKAPMSVKISGTLLHRDDIPEQIKESLTTPGELSDYCILVDANDKHMIECTGKPDTYTGYLWQCWVPDEVLGRKQRYELPALNEVYFCWEHTDYAKPDALKYNLDSLERKKQFIEGQVGGLTLVQKSSLVVPGGEPLCPTDLFYQKIFRNAGK